MGGSRDAGPAVRQRGRAPVLLVCLVGLTVGLLGCTTTEDPEPPGRRSAPELALGITQLLPRQGTRHVLLRVTNQTSRPVSVTGVGLRWAGYGGRFVRTEEADLLPRATLDISMTVPPERCDAGADQPLGVVRTPEGLVEQPLTATGEDSLRAMWERRCFEQALAEQVSVSYGDRWRLDRGREALGGHLLVERRSPGAALRFTRALGSVLHRLTLPRPVQVPASSARARVPVQVRPGNRCDEHAIGQATAPFSFRYGVELGRGAEQVLLLPPPPGLQARINGLLRLHCLRQG